VCTKIEEEVSRMIKILVKIDPVVERPNCTLKYRMIHDTLTTYYATLAKNVTLLVYKSPVMDRLAHNRSTKNQNQATKFSISSVDADCIEQQQQQQYSSSNDVSHHETTLCPLKITRALLLRLFHKPLSISIHGYRIQVWGRDMWLRGFTVPDFYNHNHNHQANKETPKGLARFEKEIGETATLVLKSLTHFNMCPLWVRDMLFRGVA
jgi:hypothetical protein